MENKKTRRAMRVRRVAKAMMLLCLAVAAGRLAAGVAPLADPRLAAAQIECRFTGCRLDRDPVRLLGDGAGVHRRLGEADRPPLQAVLREARAKLLIFAGSAVRAAAAVVLFLSLALAFRAFAGGGGFSVAAAWLRRAALAAAATVVVEPVGASLRATALSAVLTGRQQIYLSFEGGPFLWGILLSGAVWVSVWALEEASASEEELAGIV